MHRPGRLKRGTGPYTNMETHWPVRLKGGTQPTRFEREAGPDA